MKPRPRRRRKGRGRAAAALSLLLLAALAWSAQAGEWTLRVTAERATIRLKPDRAGPAAAAAAKGTILKSFVSVDGWYRVIFEPGGAGLRILGYVSSEDVAVVEKAEPEPEFWKPVSGPYRGLGISLGVNGALHFFGGGDIAAGAAGMFERTVDLALANGANVEDRRTEALRSAEALAGEVLYRFGRRLRAGLGIEYVRARTESDLQVDYGPPINAYTSFCTTRVTGFAIRPEVIWDVPVHRLVSLYFRGGPTLYRLSLEFDRKFLAVRGEDIVLQRVKATGFGLQGGLGVELHLNRRTGVFLEARGRYARIGNFKGSETDSRSWDLQYWKETRTGSLYIDEAGEHPGLTVLEGDPPAGARLRRAEFDFSGISLAAGFRVLF